MKREIKFRVWDKINKEFVKDEWAITLDGKLMCDPPYFTSLFVRDDFTVNQFTGLRDTNRKEIYEGDIIDTKQRGIEVVEIDQEYDLIGYHACWEKGIVIGNIYENPELINE